MLRLLVFRRVQIVHAYQQRSEPQIKLDTGLGHEDDRVTGQVQPIEHPERSSLRIAKIDH